MVVILAKTASRLKSHVRMRELDRQRSIIGETISNRSKIGFKKLKNSCNHTSLRVSNHYQAQLVNKEHLLLQVLAALKLDHLRLHRIRQCHVAE